MVFETEKAYFSDGTFFSNIANIQLSEYIVSIPERKEIVMPGTHQAPVAILHPKVFFFGITGEMRFIHSNHREPKCDTTATVS